MGDRIVRIARLGRMMIIILILGLTLSCAIKTTRRGISAPDPIKLQDIRVAEGVDKTIIELESEEPILYTSFRLSDPDRLVIEMADVTFGQYQDEIKISEGPVRSILLASSGELDVSRLEFLLNGLVKTEVRPDGLNIVIEVTRLEKVTGLGKTPQVEPNHKKSFIFLGDESKKPSEEDMAKPSMGGEVTEAPILSPETSEAPLNVPIVEPAVPELAPPPVPAVKPDVPVGAFPALETPSLAEEKKPVATSPAKTVTGVRFVEGKLLQLVVSADGRLSPNIFFVGKGKNRLVIDFPGVKADMPQNQIPGDAFFVKQVRFGKHPTKVRLVLDLNNPVDFSWVQKQNELWITLK